LSFNETSFSLGFRPFKGISESVLEAAKLVQSCTNIPAQFFTSAIGSSAGSTSYGGVPMLNLDLDRHRGSGKVEGGVVGDDGVFWRFCCCSGLVDIVARRQSCFHVYERSNISPSWPQGGWILKRA
jgi:hypothetical protein